jgi:hypothetical protein
MESLRPLTEAGSATSSGVCSSLDAPVESVKAYTCLKGGVYSRAFRGGPMFRLLMFLVPLVVVAFAVGRALKTSEAKDRVGGMALACAMVGAVLNYALPPSPWPGAPTPLTAPASATGLPPPASPVNQTSPSPDETERGIRARKKSDLLIAHGAEGGETPVNKHPVETVCSDQMDWNHGTIQQIAVALPSGVEIRSERLSVGQGGPGFTGSCPTHGPAAPGPYDQRQCEPAMFHDMTVEAVGRDNGVTVRVANGADAPGRHLKLCVDYVR